jgi:alkylhydroperoxidase family enzyme
LARRNGATEEEIAGLKDVERSPLPPGERQAVLFAEKMTVDHGSIGEEDFERLRAHWETEQIVELLCVIGLFNYLNRFAEAVGLEPTKPGEGGPEDREGDGQGE